MTRTEGRAVVACLLAAINVACGARQITVEFYLADDYRFSWAERRAIENIAESTAAEARRHLPMLPSGLTLRVYADKDVIPETGETGSIAVPSASVVWVVDPAHQGGVIAVVQSWLRASLLHELHHLARAQAISSDSLMDEVIAEGLATVFERDVAGVSPPWGAYPAAVASWVSELAALPPDADRNYWLRSRHPDGRRWIGMRAGAYLVDQAMKASGQSAAGLVSTSTEGVIDLAGPAGPSDSN